MVNEPINFVLGHVYADNHFFAGDTLFFFHSGILRMPKKGFSQTCKIRGPNGLQSTVRDKPKGENDAPGFRTVSMNRGTTGLSFSTFIHQYRPTTFRTYK